jgi:hypothetical protein
MLKSSVCAFIGFAALTAGCAGKPAAPFDTLKTANLTAYRLQNYEPPAAVAAAPGAAPAIPGLPPEIQTWIQQGAQGLGALIPPGLIPQGILPGGAPLPGAVDTTPRFHTFRILSQTQVMDPDLKEKLADILGDEDSFDNKNARCAPNTFYAEMGLSFTSTSSPQPNDLLVSFSCNQVVSRSFAWPHQATGMTADTVKDLSEVVQKLWPQGA